MNELANKRSNDEGLRELALFAGAGGGILAGQMLGWRTVCAVEWEAYPASVLAARQNDGHLEPFPIWDDVRTFDGSRWRGRVDVVSGGFPCQDISAAGKGAGIEGERSGMWVEMAQIIGEVRPRFAFVENSPMLTSRGLGRVLGDLAALGFDAEWGVLGANQVGAWQRRERIWIVARSAACGRNLRWRPRKTEKRNYLLESQGLVSPEHERPVPAWANTSPRKKARVLGVADGVAGELDGIAACGNGQVPQCAAAAFIEGCRRLTE